MLLIANSIMTYSLAWYDYTKADSLTKGDKLKDKMQIESLSIRILQTIHSPSKTQLIPGKIKTSFFTVD